LAPLHQMKGRKPIPTVVHEARGTVNVTRHRAGRAAEPKPSGNLGLEPPDYLTAEQKEGWRHAMTYAPPGLLKQVDRGALVVWVIAEDDLRLANLAQARLNTSTSLPMLTKDKNDQAMVSPYQHVKKNAALLMLKAASELGFTPASRPRIASGDDPELDEASPWAKFRVLNGGLSS
jgi:P27 family predicted phage terminase small subunit